VTKPGMRRAGFQVHKWIGLILAILIIPLSLTGAALVWDDALDHGLNPQRYAVTGGNAIGVQAYVDAARAVLAPGERIATIGRDDAGPVVVTANQTGKHAVGPPARTTLWLDPPSARLLDRSSGNSGLIRVMHQIHGSLMIPGVGRQIVGWIGVAMALSCFTGLWLWWPTVGKWARGLRWRRHRNLDTNLHHLTGFWVALPLFMLSLTGMWISFPGVFGGAAGRARRRPPAAARRTAAGCRHGHRRRAGPGARRLAAGHLADRSQARLVGVLRGRTRHRDDRRCHRHGGHRESSARDHCAADASPP
jgi:uncharacterized iron-regulated membrane protein